MHWLETDPKVSTASSGKPGRRRIDGGVAGGRSLKTTTMQSLPGVRSGFFRWIGEDRRCGARGHSEKARGWLWPRRRAAVLSGAFGRRKRERERGGERRRREGVRPGGAGRFWRGQVEEGRGQAGSCRGVHARGVRRPRALSLWREEGDDWRWPVSWAGLLGRARPHSARPQVSSLFLFLFLF